MEAKYRVSVSVLEKFRRYRDGISSFDTYDSVIDAITGKFVGNDKTRIGGAFHKIIETFPGNDAAMELYNLSDGLAVDGIKFSQAQAIVAVNYKLEHSQMISEVPVSKIYGEFQVTGRADGVEGNFIRDAKLKFSHPSATEYLDSYQWRFYLDMLEMDVFYYDIFEVEKYTGIKQGMIPGAIITPYEPLQCLRYEGMEQDIEILLNDFRFFILDNNLFSILKPATK